ncbi:acetate kinase [Brachybacterium sp. p3-SID1565]|uniref:Acetate kinase n=1 Tax=Brachybacterium epidermidis TaxID=2781983 RepID=A0ABR9W019_9MICO|nr:MULTISPECIES: acetate kinase [Brachybacterium]MBE9403789.1 acetate kinase [Brachybacterium epidermidis]MCT1384055.1 acetate kinase [Brachybacterium sp. p3-SID1565]
MNATPADPRVLVINSGSSSLKFQLLSPADGTVDATGIVERIGLDMGAARITAGEQESTFAGPVPDHVEAMRIVEQLFGEVGLSLTDDRIMAVGHRVVQGGARFDGPTLVDDDVRQDVYELGRLAPLHNYAAVDGIDGARKLLPEVPHVVVFDTSFFTALPDSAATYALAKDFAQQYRVRRYGAHGTSHRYVSETVSAYLAEQGKDVSDLRQIVLHLGNGASASAIRGGVPQDTSMGLTPLEGLVMGTRTGDIDPSVYIHLHRQAGLSADEIDTILNKRSGMLGLCGMSDFRDITAAVDAGDETARLALDVYVHRLRKYIGSYAFVLGGVDTIAFTAGIGENVWQVREQALADLEGFGIELDLEKNRERSKQLRVISTPESAVTVLVVPTDEELAIAQQAAEVAAAL